MEKLMRKQMMDLIDKWSKAGFEEGHYKKTEWGLGVFHQRYASGNLEGWGGELDDFIIRGFDLGSAPEAEALKELNEILNPKGYEAEYMLENTVHQDIRIKEMR